jgi:hypothetical protein
MSSLLDETIEAVATGLSTTVYQRPLTPHAPVKRKRKTGKPDTMDVLPTSNSALESRDTVMSVSSFYMFIFSARNTVSPPYHCVPHQGTHPTMD